MLQEYDVVVVGAGQAGIAMGYYLRRGGYSFCLVDAAPEVGHVWRTRYDSLRLFTPAQYNNLPGWDFPGEANAYPTKDAAADYLQQYVERFNLPVHLQTKVSRIWRNGQRFHIETNRGSYIAKQVVIATGPFQKPYTPTFAGGLPESIVQLHTSAYRGPSQLAQGPVLVVGAGNSGAQIAEELSRDRKVYLAVGGHTPVLPQRFLGRDLFWWLHRLGLMRVSGESWLGKRMRANDPLIGTDLRTLVKRNGVRLLPRAVGVSGEQVLFADGGAVGVPNVIWGTGFRYDYSWVDLPGFEAERPPAAKRGVTEIPGLYMLGLPWLHTRGSALLGGVGADAAYLAEQIGLLRHDDGTRS